VNIDTLPPALKWLAYVSFIKFAYEGMMINELDRLQLLLDAPGYPSFDLEGNVILDQLGVDVTMLVPNLFILLGMIGWYIFWSYIFLRFAIKERR